MQKTFIERIAAHNEDKTKKPIAKNKVDFLILKDDIADALEKGWPIIAIWGTLHEEGKITTSYNTFRLNIAKYINGQTNIRRSNQTAKTKSAAKGFVFDPKPDLSKLF